MTEASNVTRLRISHVGARICDALRDVGEPVAFARRLTGLGAVAGLPVGLPFGDDVPLDTQFWSRIAERSLTVPVPETDAPRLRRAGVPLRLRGTLEVGGEAPRVEAHLHPFGVVVMTTVDLSWTDPVPLEEVSDRVGELEALQARTVFGTSTLTGPLATAAQDAARGLITLLADPAGQAWDQPQHRLATVISGAVAGSVEAMPAPNSPLHLALHHLSAGGSVVADPSTAFVAQWSGAGYAWPPASLVYMLDCGTAVLAAEVARPASAREWGSTADRHRRLLLLVAYLTAAVGLVRAAPSAGGSVYFAAWANTFAKRLGLLFGPGRDFLDWGLVPRALLQRIGASDDVARILGAPLTPNAAYPVPDYH